MFRIRFRNVFALLFVICSATGFFLEPEPILLKKLLSSIIHPVVTLIFIIIIDISNLKYSASARNIHSKKNNVLNTIRIIVLAPVEIKTNVEHGHLA